MPIKQKQWQLSYLGYYGGEIDGIWGAESKAAAVSFQKDNALDADGIFGTQTIAKSTEMNAALHHWRQPGENVSEFAEKHMLKYTPIREGS